MEPIQSVRGLSARYRRRPEAALEGVDLDLVPGEVILVTGPSGSGKTTLVRVLNGLIPRSYPGAEVGGTARLDGRDLFALEAAAIARLVGTLLQEPARQVVGSTAWRELAFGPENLGLPVEQVQARVEAAAARLGIESLLERAPDELSGGELQKVALAGVLAMQPRVLLLDEPLAALDPVSSRAAARLFRDLADEGRAVVVIEHRTEDLLTEARPERVVVVAEGRARVLATSEFLEEADPRHLRLPAEVAVKRWRALGAVGTESPAAESPAAESPAAESSAAESSAAESSAAESSAAESSAPQAPQALVDPPPLIFEAVGFDRGPDHAVLSELDLELRTGETFALLGANGAGKSTLLRLGMGLLRPARGRVLLDGEDMRERTVAEAARTVGLAFQDPGAMLFADTVVEECRFAPDQLGLDDPDGCARRAIAQLGLEALAAESPGALSTGQRKRVCLAALASQGIRVWLLDEPTAGLDPSAVRGFLDALRSGRGEGDSVLLATHDVDLALLHADRIGVLRAGRLAAVGPPAAILRDAALLESARVRATSLVLRNGARLDAGLSPLDARGLAAEENGR